MDILSVHLAEERISEAEFDLLMTENSSSENPSARVLATPELFKSLEFLEAILEEEVPVRYLIRYTEALSLIYGFVDASGRGFAGTFEDESKEGLDAEIGV